MAKTTYSENMNFVFRVDASLQIGNGHVMRCLTLADGLTDRGHVCIFICRPHLGNLISFIRKKGYRVIQLPTPIIPAISEGENLYEYTTWLGEENKVDALQTVEILNEIYPLNGNIDWLIIDHYAISSEWEKVLRPHIGNILIIDDLANRQYVCEILLDQTFGRAANDYKQYVAESCVLLLGSNYALLRPEFRSIREYSLTRRSTIKLEHILITMGGTDKDNYTEKVLQALRSCPLPENGRISVVLGGNAPWLESVKKISKIQNLPVHFIINTNEMARLMAESDLCIGAAGSTTWERCCLGLPTISIPLAENQKKILSNLSSYGAIIRIDNQSPEHISRELKNILTRLNNNKADLETVIGIASSVTDGNGVARVVQIIEGYQ